MDYVEACYSAAKAQGLEEIVCRLATRGIAATIEQTGGFCMVAYVSVGGKTIGITAECAGVQDGPIGADYDGDSFEVIESGNTPAEIVAAVEEYIREHSQK
jgi:hypothetical protein